MTPISNSLRTFLMSLMAATAAVAMAAGNAAATAVPEDGACAGLAGVGLAHAVTLKAETIADGQFAPPLDARGSAADRRAFAKLRSFCRVAATLSPVEGSTIGIEVWLPATGWNGKFQAVGNRGWGGSIAHSALAAAVTANYAAAATDTGHRGGGASFALEQPEAIVDAGYRAVHETTVAAKALMASYYGTPPTRSYWNGCSLGGRQGLSEAQRYPADYDGIVAGDPANNLVDLYAARLLQAREVHRTPASAIPPETFPLIHRAVLSACDRADGVADGVLEDPRRCTFDPAVLRCVQHGTADCLTEEQVETARRLYAPVRELRGAQAMSAPLMAGSELGWTSVAGPEPESNALGLFRFIVAGNRSWNWQGDDMADRIEEARRNWSPVLDAVDPDLRPFVERGGKLLLYHGWADPQTPPGNTIAYHARVTERIGQSRADGSVRLFMVPGMGHCEGGPGTDSFDKVAVLDRWVTSGIPPESIEASRTADGQITRTRPLCRFGATAVWDGQGSTDTASSFSCQ